MDHPIVATLALLRKIKSTPGLGLDHSGLLYVHAWTGDHTSTVVMRTVVGISEQLQAARAFINTSHLGDEAKAGLLATVDALVAVFSIGTINNAVRSYLPALDSAITNFAILASSTSGSVAAAEEEIRSLSSDILEFAAEVSSMDIDPYLKEVIVKQLRSLSAMIINALVVGTDEALSCYLSMLARVKRAELSAVNPVDAPGFWDKARTWSDRLSSMNSMMNSGAGLLAYLPTIGNVASSARKLMGQG